MPIIIREVAEPELPALLHLYTYLHPSDSALPLGAAAEIWKSMAQLNQLVYGAYWSGEIVEGSEIVGKGGLVAACTLIIISNLTRGGRPCALIENVITHPEYRRRGCGTAALKQALAAAWEHNCYKVMLLTGSQTEATLRFYENAGFERGTKTSFVARPRD